MKVIINGREFASSAVKLTYEEIANLVDQVEPTITWHKSGQIGGTVSPGDDLQLIDGMIINALNTGSA